MGWDSPHCLLSWENGVRDSLLKGVGLGMVKLMCLPHFPFYLKTRREGPEQKRGKVEFHEDTHVQHAVLGYVHRAVH